MRHADPTARRAAPRATLRCPCGQLYRAVEAGAGRISLVPVPDTAETVPTRARGRRWSRRRLLGFTMGIVLLPIATWATIHYFGARDQTAGPIHLFDPLGDEIEIPEDDGVLILACWSRCPACLTLISALHETPLPMRVILVFSDDEWKDEEQMGRALAAKNKMSAAELERKVAELHEAREQAIEKDPLLGPHITYPDVLYDNVICCSQMELGFLGPGSAQFDCTPMLYDRKSQRWNDFSITRFTERLRTGQQMRKLEEMASDIENAKGHPERIGSDLSVLRERLKKAKAESLKDSNGSTPKGRPTENEPSHNDSDEVK